jgi:hypothetical protein
MAAALKLWDGHPEARAAATVMDPLLWAVLYHADHLKGPSTGDLISLSEFHLEVCRWGASVLTLQGTRMRELRDAFIAPRESGKSTWLFLIVVLWAAAHEHTRFTVAFADTATQARDHLTTLRLELQDNERLAADWPALTAPAMQDSPRRPIAQRDDDVHQANGWRMVVRGADKAALGLKKGSDRPDLVLCDDMEPDEANYSPHLMRRRLITLLDTILPLNLAARLVLSGTVTMPGSIMHQLLQHQLGETPVDEAKERAWIQDEGFRVHYQEPIVTGPDGVERSWWPEKWRLSQLLAMRHTRSYRKNMENRPLAGEGDYWTSEHFHYLELDGYGRTVLYVDPATTTKSTSDWTGLAVVSRAPARAERNTLHVRYATHVRLVGERLRVRVQAILAEHQDIGAIVVETNAGGDYLLEALQGLGVPVIPDPATESKEVRAERVLDLYERQPTVVYHAERFTILESEMEAFPTPGVHDDVLDATVGGLLFLLRRKRGRKVQQHSYA